jgi:drug/metabolite transporter (DMT)-like permease
MKALRLDLLGTLFVLVWASGYVVGSLATEVVAPLTLCLWRFVVAAALLALVAVVRHEPWPRGRGWWPLLGIGVPMFGLQFGGFYQAMADGLPAGTAALIACSAPLAVAATGAAIGRERLVARQWAGILLGVAGVTVTLADRVGRPPSPGALGWALLGLAGLVAGTLLQARLRTDAGPAVMATLETVGAVGVFAVWAPLSAPLTLPVGVQALGSAAWLTVMGVAASLLLLGLIRSRGATRTSVLLYPVPAVTALAAWPVLGKPLGLGTGAGLVIVLVALWLVRRAAPARPPRRPVRAAAAAEPERTGRPALASQPHG